MKQIRNPLHFILLNLALLFVVLISTSCASPIPTPPATTPVVVVASSTATVLPTQVPASPTSTTTRTPTSTQTRLPRPTATPLPTKTATPTKYPTLDSQGRLNFVLQAMKTNMGCELPCWWGITPGKTTWTEMVDSFVKQGVGFSEAERLSLTTRDINDRRQSLDVIVDVNFQAENGVISAIDIELEPSHWLAKAEYPSVLERYTLQTALTEHGVPSQAYLNLDTNRGVWDYDLWLVYDTEGIAIGYRGELIRDNRGWYVCPISDNKYGIAVRLRPPESHAPLVDVTLGKNDYGFSGTLIDLAKVSPQQLHAMYTQNPPPGCLMVSDPDPWWYDKITLPKPSVVLPVAQEEEYLINNLAGNAGCELPCWWGIKPDETTTQYVRQMFLNLGKSVSRSEDSRGLQYRASLFGRHAPYPFDYTVEHRWFDKNGVVNLLGVTGSALNWSPPQHFTQDWQRYSLHEALARYGVPTKVLVHYWNFGVRYDITLVYEDKGFLIRYSGSIIDEGDESSEKPVVICPTQNKPTEITIWMTRPANGALASFGYGLRDVSQTGFPMPSLEEITDLTVQDFYNTFLKPDATMCLTVPRDRGDMAP